MPVVIQFIQIRECTVKSFNANLRAVVYIFLLLTFFTVKLQLNSNNWHNHSIVFYSTVDLVGGVVALIVGLLSILKHYFTKQAYFLLIGIGFIGASVINFYQLVITTPYFASLISSSQLSITTWTW